MTRHNVGLVYDIDFVVMRKMLNNTDDVMQVSHTGRPEGAQNKAKKRNESAVEDIDGFRYRRVEKIAAEGKGRIARETTNCLHV